MSPAALALVLVSVCMHAGWNVLGKRNAPSLSSFTLAYGAAGLVMFPLVLLGPSLVALPNTFWGWLALSGLCQMLYMGGLAWAYARGEVSVLYPIARALPVVLVPLVSVALMSSRVLDMWDGLGMALIVGGALCLPLSHPEARRFSTYITPAMGFALLAALRQQGLPMLVITGLMMTCTYGLVLIAMAITDEVSYIVALRQLSIPVGVFMGVLWLKEPASSAKTLGTLVMLAGLMLVAL